MTIEEIVEQAVDKSGSCSCAYIRSAHPEIYEDTRRDCDWCGDFGFARYARRACHAVAKAVVEECEQDAKRWRYFATSPQTALLLGSQLDPNDKTVDWVAECNRLVDSLAAPVAAKEGK